MSVFDQARGYITAAWIEREFGSAGAYWEGAEYWTLNPARADSRIGSFHIREDGQWYDHATSEGGDVFKLLASRDGVSVADAAREIIKRGGGEVEETRKSKKSQKPKPVIPAPESALSALGIATKSEYALDKHGRVTKAWKYHTREGGIAFCVVRYDNERGKDVIPYYYGEDGRWHEGQPYKSLTPLYRLNEILTSTLPVLVVEGEKCAAVDVPGYIVTTWAGGSSQATKADWTPLEGREVLIWPDADAPGLKAAHAIEMRLPHAKVLDIKGRPSGWDIADAVGDPEFRLGEFLASCPRLMPADVSAPAGPFICLGYSTDRYWFLTSRQRLPYSIIKGQFNGSKLQELAPVSWWGRQGMVTDQGGIKVPLAQDMIVTQSEEAGMYDEDALRGAGVWRDGDGIVINDGSRIVHADGSNTAYGEYRSSSGAHYIASKVKFGDMSGASSSDEEGRTLIELMLAQRFTRKSQALAALGWALIAPYGGVLHWRPHIWLTGRKGTGKTYVLESIISSLCGPFAHVGSGKDTEAGIRRTLNMDARPVILDEMEPKKGEAERVRRILDLVRNASSDGSANITMADGGSGTAHYRVRSCFACASVNIPEEGAAISSRFVVCELQAVQDEQAKRDYSRSLYALVTGKWDAYRRRIFRALPQIIADIEYLRDGYAASIGDGRLADLWAPLICAVWSLSHSGSIDCPEGTDLSSVILDELVGSSDERVEDEDRVIEHILAYQVRTDDNKTRTVSELLRSATLNREPEEAARQTLSRVGIGWADYRNGDGGMHRGLAIASRCDAIERMLAGTAYEHGYDAQIKRNRLCRTDKTVQVALAIGRVRCRVLDWDGFVSTYMGGLRGEQGELNYQESPA